MNLNDPNKYNVIIFKKTYFYKKNYKMTTRDVFFHLTKDGEKPVLGTQHIYLLNDEMYQNFLDNQSLTNESIFKNEELIKISNYHISNKGFKKGAYHG